MSRETIEVSCEDGVAVVRLNRPDKLNAFNVRMHRELRDALREVERDPAARVLAITGAGRAFSAGQDLAELGETPVDQRLRVFYNPLILAVHRFARPVVAALNGVAAGAGLSLALACDLRVASARARLVPAFCAVGLVPDSGLSYFLPRLVGYGRALAMCLEGKAVEAGEALELGLVHQVVEEEAFERTWRGLCARLAQGPLSFVYTKRVLQRGMQRSLDEHLEYEAWHQRLAADSADGREGVLAFLEKRQPRFTGQ